MRKLVTVEAVLGKIDRDVQIIQPGHEVQSVIYIAGEVLHRVDNNHIHEAIFTVLEHLPERGFPVRNGINPGVIDVATAEDPFRVVLNGLSAIGFLIHTVGIVAAFPAVVKDPKETFVQSMLVSFSQTPFF